MLVSVLEQHVASTGSVRARRVLADLDAALDRIWVVMPSSEKTNPLLAKDDAAAASVVDAVVPASVPAAVL